MSIVQTVICSTILAGLITSSFSLSAEAATKKKIEYRARRLDGVAVQKGVENTWPIAVMIDNHTAARPQAGLDKASIVYESLAEGGIPRFMAVFADTNVPLIGPVRSTRPYFVRYAAEYGAAMAHAGGSPDGLRMVKNLRLLSLLGIKGKYAKYFYRRGSGVHSLYTDSKKLYAAYRTSGYRKVKPSYRPYTFVADISLGKRGKNGSGVNIDLGYGRSYDIKYTYDRKRNVYLRSTGGLAHRDKVSRKQLYAKNVVIVTTPKERVLDKKGRLDIHTIGHDKGMLLKNGKAVPITWTKKGVRSRTIFKTRDGKEVNFVRGSIWITVVPRGHKYSIF